MPSSTVSPLLEGLVAALPRPATPLHGRRPDALALPGNLICFQRKTFAELNRPRRGRALHHRFVLICALKTTVAVCVDDVELTLEAGQGLLIFPFQFHHYLRVENAPLCWLFVTFEHPSPESLGSLRNRPFALTTEVRGMLADLLAVYEGTKQAELPVLLLAVLLARLRAAKPTLPAASGATSLVTQVNVLAQRGPSEVGVKELSGQLGISLSHMRARFRASCGVSLGRHLRRLRLEKACGLLRLSDARVSEVAEQCGFNSIFSFSRAFRGAYGISPLKYRRSDGPPRPKPTRRRAA